MSAADGAVLLKFMAQACAYAQEHIDDSAAWPVEPSDRENYLTCVAHVVSCFLARNTVMGDEGVASDVVLEELKKHPGKSEDEWCCILTAYAEKLGGWKHRTTPWETHGIKTATFRVRYKSRTPDPGICRVIACDWERRSLTVSNGRCTYFPKFDEVEEVTEA